jgi:hypothetical protein
MASRPPTTSIIAGAVATGLALVTAFGIGVYVGRSTRSKSPSSSSSVSASSSPQSSNDSKSGNTLLALDDRIAFIDGEFMLQHLAKVPITDRGFQFGDGVFISGTNSISLHITCMINCVIDATALIEDGVVLLWYD